jgi:hypothetical protein
VNNQKVAAALRLLADAFETPAETPPQQPAAAPAAEPAKRGRGRPAKGEGEPTTAPAAPQAPEAPAAAPPKATQAEVRAALTALKDATTQEIAVGVLKSFAENMSALKPEQYDALVAACQAKLPATPAPAPVVEADPFETSAPAAKPPTIEDVKAALVDAQKRAGVDTAQKVLMAHGGAAPDADGAVKPSLKALPEASYAACIAAAKALPTTK